MINRSTYVYDTITSGKELKNGRSPRIKQPPRPCARAAAPWLGNWCMMSDNEASDNIGCVLLCFLRTLIGASGTQHVRATARWCLLSALRLVRAAALLLRPCSTAAAADAWFLLTHEDHYMDERPGRARRPRATASQTHAKFCGVWGEELVVCVGLLEVGGRAWHFNLKYLFLKHNTDIWPVLYSHFQPYLHNFIEMLKQICGLTVRRFMPLSWWCLETCTSCSFYPFTI